VTGDTTFEPNETFTVHLSNPVNATISDADGTGTIVNDDPPPPLAITSLQWSGTDLHIYFGAAVAGLYRLERSDDLEANVWVTVVDNIQGTGATVECTDSSAATRPQGFYRIRRLE